MKIGNKEIGEGKPVFIIAEVGINHNGSLDLAKKHIDAAAAAGADAVKFQVFAAERMYVPDAGDYSMMGQSLKIYDLVKQTEFKKEWLPELKDYAESKGLVFFASVFSEDDVDYLEKYNVRLYKIASYELTHIPLFEHVAKTKKPVIFSTGAGGISEIDYAVKTILAAGNKDFAIMHCIAEYPAHREDANLAAMGTLSKAFGAVVGLSDHSFKPDIMEIPLAAVALGAKIIEKHFTLSRELPGPDHKFAIEPTELKILVAKIRDLENRMKKGEKIAADPVLVGSPLRYTYDREKYVRNFTYRSIYAKKPIRTGELLTKDNLIVLRPGNAKPGIEPKYYTMLLNNNVKVARNLNAFEPITWDVVLSK